MVQHTSTRAVPGKGPALVDSEAFEDAENPRKHYLWTAIGAVLGLVLLYVAVRKVDVASLGDTLKTVGYGPALSVIALQASFIALKAWRWRMLLRFIPGAKFNELHSAVYIGLAINYLVAHLGEFVRSMTVARSNNVPAGTVLASVFVERSLDFVALLVLVASVAVFAADVPQVVTLAGGLIAVVVVCAIAGFYLILRPPAWVMHYAISGSKRLPAGFVDWITGQLDKFKVGLVSIKDGRLMAATMAISLLQWIIVVVLMWVSALAIGEVVSATAATMTFVLIVVGLTLPNSPMQIGTTQLAFMIGLGVDGVTATAAVAASLVFTAFAIVPTMVVGGLCVLRGKAGRSSVLR